jgi:hypothetical protein
MKFGLKGNAVIEQGSKGGIEVGFKVRKITAARARHSGCFEGNALGLSRWRITRVSELPIPNASATIINRSPHTTPGIGFRLVGYGFQS